MIDGCRSHLYGWSARRSRLPHDRDPLSCRLHRRFDPDLLSVVDDALAIE